MDSTEAVIYRIKQLCKERGLTYSALATLCGMERSTIYKFTRGRSKKPWVSTIKIICDGLEITLGEFFSTPEFDALEQEIK